MYPLGCLHSFSFFFLLDLLTVWLPLSCLQVRWFFLPLNLVEWTLLLNFSYQELFPSDLWSLFSTFYIFHLFVKVSLSSCTALLISFSIFMTIILNSLSGKSLNSVSLRPFSKDEFYSFVWNIVLSFFISLDTLCWFLYVKTVTCPSVDRRVSCKRWTLSVSLAWAPGRFSNLVLVQAAVFVLGVCSRLGCADTRHCSKGVENAHTPI